MVLLIWGCRAINFIDFFHFFLIVLTFCNLDTSLMYCIKTRQKKKETCKTLWMCTLSCIMRMLYTKPCWLLEPCYFNPAAHCYYQQFEYIPSIHYQTINMISEYCYVNSNNHRTMYSFTQGSEEAKPWFRWFITETKPLSCRDEIHTAKCSSGTHTN